MTPRAELTSALRALGVHPHPNARPQARLPMRVEAVEGRAVDGALGTLRPAARFGWEEAE